MKYYTQSQGERNILHAIKGRLTGFVTILHRNCLLKHVIEGETDGKIEVKGRRQRRRKQILHDLKEKSGYCKLKVKALYRTPWRIHFGRDYGPVVNRPQNELYWRNRFIIEHYYYPAAPPKGKQPRVPTK